MIKNILFILICFTFFNCKKKSETPEEATPAPKPTSSINIFVTSYDSLGTIDNNNGSLPISFYQTSYSATTNTVGLALFSNIPYDTYVPILNKIGYDTAPLSITLNSANTLTVNLPFAKQSPYKMDTLIGQSLNKDSITLTFNLSKSIPVGKTVKLAVITGTNNGLNPNDFISVDIINLSSPNVVKLNVAKLPNFANAVAALATNTNFYVNAIPVTYGSYYSNILYKNVLLGDNLFYKNNLIFLKNW
ncbi:MAG: hypothetical protein SFY56_06385 [Bacteroidota bacterium]|nr:hypothetical protein [Bacteroidota bacterium]